MKRCIWLNGSTNKTDIMKMEMPEFCKKRKCNGIFPDEKIAQRICERFLSVVEIMEGKEKNEDG